MGRFIIKKATLARITIQDESQFAAFLWVLLVIVRGLISPSLSGVTLVSELTLVSRPPIAPVGISSIQ
jgi:hypothetical protein